MGSLVVMESKDRNPVISAKIVKPSKNSEYQEGDTALVNSNAGIQITFKGQEYFIIREQGNVYAIL